MNTGEISVTSVSTAIMDDFRTPPPAYNVIFKNPVFEGDDKLPSYEETVGNTENSNSRSDGGDVENGRFWLYVCDYLVSIVNGYTYIQ